METNVFVLGGILLLIALLGGGFEAKGFKIPPVSGGARVVSGVLSLLFFASAIFLIYRPPAAGEKDLTDAEKAQIQRELELRLNEAEFKQREAEQMRREAELRAREAQAEAEAAAEKAKRAEELARLAQAAEARASAKRTAERAKKVAEEKRKVANVSAALAKKKQAGYARTTKVLETRRCEDAVQGKIAWDYKNHTTWKPENVKKLCAGGAGVEPATCFQRVMHGGVNKGSTDKWRWSDALDLCGGSQNASQTIQCFQAKLKSSIPWKESIVQCAKG